MPQKAKTDLKKKIVRSLFDALAIGQLELFEIDVLYPGHTVAKAASHERFLGPFSVTYGTLKALMVDYRHFLRSVCTGFKHRFDSCQTTDILNITTQVALDEGLLLADGLAIVNNPNVFGSSIIRQARDAAVERLSNWFGEPVA